MNGTVSRKLHALRFIAALLVVAAHTSQLGYSGVGHGCLEALGRLGVIVFFVLSGYVIAYVGEVRHPDFTDFMIARLARLHSVLLPALLVTFLADRIGSVQAPDLYVGFPSSRDAHALATAPAFALFLNQSFGIDIRWLSNSPLWSIAYEFWYYILFGILTYLRGLRRWLTLIVCVAACGIKILLLWPIWLVGVALYRYRHHVEKIRPSTALLAGVAGVVGLAFLCLPKTYASYMPLRQFGIEVIGQNFSGFLPWDLVLIPGICLMMLAIIQPEVAARGARASQLITWLAGSTFSIYAYHLPLLLLPRSTGAYDSTSPWQATLSAVSVVLTCVILSLFTERKKHFWHSLWATILRYRTNR